MNFTISNLTSPLYAPTPQKRLPVQTGFNNGWFANDQKLATDPKFWRRQLLLGGGDADVVAFQLAPAPARVLPITVNGSYAGFRAPGSPWTVGAVRRQFRLKAALGGGLEMASAYQDWDQNSNDFRVDNFEILAPAVTNYPFRTSGAWTWTIESQPHAPWANLAVNSDRQTTVEMFVFVGDMDPLFAGRHWAELLRWCIPDHAAFAALTAGHTVDWAQHQYLEWLAPRLFNGLHGGLHVWYDTWNGSASFTPVIPGAQRQFLLSNFLNVASRPADSYGRLNCFDLATFFQLCCKAFGNRNTAVAQYFISAAIWGSTNRWGFIPPGELFGWPAHGTLNSPIFNSNGSAPNIGQTDPQRTKFGFHWWVESTDDAGLTRRVIDICHAVRNGLGVQILAAGNIERTPFINASVDLVVPPGQAVALPSTVDGELTNYDGVARVS